MEFKDRLKELREIRGISQVVLSEKLGVSNGTIAMLETGKRNPSIQLLEDIADYFNVTLDYLTGKEDKSYYYLDPETAGITQKIFERPDVKALFDLSVKATPDDVKATMEILKRLTDKKE